MQSPSQTTNGNNHGEETISIGDVLTGIRLENGNPFPGIQKPQEWGLIVK
jgi:hypothetical protein